MIRRQKQESTIKESEVRDIIRHYNVSLDKYAQDKISLLGKVQQMIDLIEEKKSLQFRLAKEKANLENDLRKIISETEVKESDLKALKFNRDLMVDGEDENVAETSEINDERF